MKSHGFVRRNVFGFTFDPSRPDVGDLQEVNDEGCLRLPTLHEQKENTEGPGCQSSRCGKASVTRAILCRTNVASISLRSLSTWSTSVSGGTRAPSGSGQRHSRS